MIRGTIILLSLTCLTHSSSLGESLTPTDALNEFSSESAQCAAYYSTSIECFSQSGQLKSAEKAQPEKARDAALERLFIAGKAAGLSEAARLARFQLAMKHLMKVTDNECRNIGVLINRYAEFCKALIEKPNERLDKLMVEGPRKFDE